MMQNIKPYLCRFYILGLIKKITVILNLPTGNEDAFLKQFMLENGLNPILYCVRKEKWKYLNRSK